MGLNVCSVCVCVSRVLPHFYFAVFYPLTQRLREFHVALCITSRYGRYFIQLFSPLQSNFLRSNCIETLKHDATPPGFIH